MTPQEKAQELVSSFMSIRNIKLSDYSVIYLPAAKQCAVISVKNILNSHIIKGQGAPAEVFKYWSNVINEINKL